MQGLPTELADAYQTLEGLAARRRVTPGDKKHPLPVPVAHRAAAKELWTLGLVTLNASKDRRGEYFSQAVMTPVAARATVLVMPVAPIGDVSARVELIGDRANELLLVASAGADITSLPSDRSPRTRFEVRHAGIFSVDHNGLAVQARLDFAAVEIVRIDRWGTELTGVIIDAAMSGDRGASNRCDCDLEDHTHLVVEETEPFQDDSDLDLIGRRARVVLQPVRGSLV